MPYYAYILKCADDSYYTGSTGNLARRLWQHEQGLSGEAYTFHADPLSWFGVMNFRFIKMLFLWNIKPKVGTEKRKKLLSAAIGMESTRS